MSTSKVLEINGFDLNKSTNINETNLNDELVGKHISE